MGANIQGYNPDAGIVRPEAAREEARRPTLNALNNLTQDSLKVVDSYQVIQLCMPSAYMDIPKSMEIALKGPIRILIRPRNKLVFLSA